jgi:hypothetical protein
MVLARATRQKLPRPVAEEMLSIRVRDVRPLVELHQQTVLLNQVGKPLALLWRWRSGGCLGPDSAAAMNARQSQAREYRPAAAPQLDRGATGGWHLDLICPVCAKPRRRLFCPHWSLLCRPESRPWACRHCHRVTYASSNRPGTSNGRRPPSYHYRKHAEAAERIRRDYLGCTATLRSRIHEERREALLRLTRAHEILATLAWEAALNRYAIQLGMEPSTPEGGWWAALAKEQIRENSWATRQSRWHRRGRPRPGPGDPSR